jgi:serine/threonine protein kinase
MSVRVSFSSPPHRLSSDLLDKEVGIGTFGKVFQCQDLKYQEKVAIKIVRNIRKYVDSAKIEAQILDTIYLEQKAAKQSGCLKLYSHFKYDGSVTSLCLSLSLSLCLSLLSH